MMASVQLQGIIEDIPRATLDRDRCTGREMTVYRTPRFVWRYHSGTVHTAESKLLAPIDIVIPLSPLPSGLVSRLGVQVDGRRATSGFRMKDRRLGVFRLGV